MTFDEYWRRRRSATPELSVVTGKMTMSVGSFERELRRAFEAGQRDAEELRKAIEDFRSVFGSEEKLGRVVEGLDVLNDFLKGPGKRR